MNCCHCQSWVCHCCKGRDPKKHNVPQEPENFVVGDHADETSERWYTPNEMSRKPSGIQKRVSIQIPSESESMFQYQDDLSLPSNNNKYSAVRALLFTLSALFGNPPEEYSAMMDKSFYDLGGNEENTIIAITFLRQYKYKIDILDFLSSMSLREIVMRMHRPKDHISSLAVPLEERFSCRKMKYEDLDFLLCCFQVSGIDKGGHSEIEWTGIWKTAIKKGHFLIFLKTSDKSPIGVALNFDIFDEYHSHLVTMISGKPFTFVDIQKHGYQMSSKPVLIELLQFLGDNLRSTKKLVQPIFLTVADLQPSDLVAIWVFMEKQNFHRVKQFGFKWIVASCPKPLQEQIERQLMGFEVLRIGNECILTAKLL